MGYAVLHLEKVKGADSGMSAHIERTIQPKNADPKRTHLNRELIQFPDGVKNRTEAIQHRLDTAGLKRKIGKNQVQAIRIVLTGTHADMERIEQTGRLDEWCQDNLDWLRKTYGADNVVSAVLHMDEETPHIHATVVPIVQTERKKQKKEQAVKKKYRTKAPAPRLCADEVMSRVNLIRYQDTYAEQMAAYGLQRGIKGSEAQHISTHEYYRSLIAQGEDLQANITQLLEKEAEAREVIAEAEQAKRDLARIKAEVKTEELKNSATKTATTALNGLNSLLGGNKVNRLERENTQLHKSGDSLIRCYSLNNPVTDARYSGQLSESCSHPVAALVIAFHQLMETLQKLHVVLIILKDVLPINATQHYVVDTCAACLACLSGHIYCFKLHQRYIIIVICQHTS